MKKDVFLSSQHPLSKRWAVLEDDGSSAWLYLTEKNSEMPLSDCFVYSPIVPLEKMPFEEIQKTGIPPPMIKEYASERAIILDPDPKDFEIQWTSDGEGVAIKHKNFPIAMIIGAKQRGLSKAVSKSGPYALPWNDQIYFSKFKNQK